MLYFSFSENQGKNWSALEPGNIKSPLSPASIERIPGTGDLLLAWNNSYAPIRDGGKRTPFNVAISKDEGKTWQKIKTVESDPNGWYCYTAIEFVENFVLLGHCAGDRTKYGGLETTISNCLLSCGKSCCVSFNLPLYSAALLNVDNPSPCMTLARPSP